MYAGESLLVHLICAFAPVSPDWPRYLFFCHQFFFAMRTATIDMDRLLLVDIPLRSFLAARWRRQALHRAIHQSNNDTEEVEMQRGFVLLLASISNPI